MNVEWVKIDIRPSVTWTGYLAELTGRCGLPCEIGKGRTEQQAINDLVRQIAGRVKSVDIKAKKILLSV